MTISKLMHSTPSQRPIAVAQALLFTSLLIFSGITSAEPALMDESNTPLEAIAVPQESTELGIYKQRFEVTADVMCQVRKKGPSYCTVNIGPEIEYHVKPEMILKYTSIILDEQEFASEVTPQGTLRFRTNKINYSGPQTFTIEIIYIK